MKSKLSCVIVDDEPHAIGLLKNLLTDFGSSISVVGEAEDVSSAVEVINNTSPDVVFLDIQLGKEQGFEVLELTTEKDYTIIFTTAYNEYAIKAFEYGAIHYLLKPINVNELEKAIFRVKEKKNVLSLSRLEELASVLRKQESKRLALPSRQGKEFVEQEYISHCIASGCYTELFLKNGDKRMISKPLSYFEELLDKSIFCRTHKKYLVNTKEVIFLEKGKTATLHMRNGDKLYLSGNFKENFQLIMGNL